MRALAALTALLLLAPASAQAKRPPERISPNPSAVVAAEIGFNQLAQSKGQWTAFRETAAKDAVMFVPEQVVAQLWLKGRKDPAQPVKWQAHKIFMSCDGLAAVSTGAWQRPDGSAGYFTTIWRRDDKGRWKWVLDHGDALTTPRDPGEMIAARIATCPTPRPPLTAMPTPGQSPDATLRWTATVRPDLSRTLVVTLATAAEAEVVLTDDVGPPK